MLHRNEAVVKNLSGDTGVVALITKLKPQPNTDINVFKDWLVELMMASGESPGFWSSEIIPPAHFTEEVWTLIQRFKSVEQANQWKQSESLKRLMTYSNGSEGSKAVIVNEAISAERLTGLVATAIVTNVVPEQNEFFTKWELKIQKAQARFPGYSGTYWRPPVEEDSSEFTTLLSFDSPASLQNWMESDERKQLLTEVTNYVESTKFSSLHSAFPGWFPLDPHTGQQPPNWKTSMLVLAALFPLVIVVVRFVSPMFPGMNFELFNFLSTVCNMVIVTWVCMPVLIKLFSWWLFPDSDRKLTVNLAGVAILLAIYGIELALL
jgi:antibiotic biosynthesis monooxygenase (ABM) superfamily enzyme